MLRGLAKFASRGLGMAYRGANAVGGIEMGAMKRAAIGAGAGGAWGAFSDDTSVIGGAIGGAALGALGPWAARTAAPKIRSAQVHARAAGFSPDALKKLTANRGKAAAMKSAVATIPPVKGGAKKVASNSAIGAGSDWGDPDLLAGKKPPSGFASAKTMAAPGPTGSAVGAQVGNPVKNVRSLGSMAVGSEGKTAILSHTDEMAARKANIAARGAGRLPLNSSPNIGSMDKTAFIGPANNARYGPAVDRIGILAGVSR